MNWRSIISLFFTLTSLILAVMACQAFPINKTQETRAKPPWITPSTGIPSPNATRTPLIIPDRTSIQFRTVGQKGLIDRDSAIFNHPTLFVVTRQEDISPFEDLIYPESQEALYKLDYSTMMAVAVFGVSQDTTDASLSVAKVYLAEDKLQIYSFDQMILGSIRAPTSWTFLHPYHIVRIPKDELPDQVLVELFFDSNLVSEIPIDIRE